MRRFYFSQVLERTDAGAVKLRPDTRAFVPLFRTVIGHGAVAADDARLDPLSDAGWVLCEVDTTAEEHTAMLAAPGVVYVPLEDGSGAWLWPGARVSELGAPQRTLIRTRLAALGISVEAVPATATLRQLVRWIRRRLEIRQLLRANDFGTNLSALVSSLPAARRSAATTLLQSRGFDTSTIRATDTVEQALNKLLAQEPQRAREVTP